tara:strand:- start:1892 stop:3574 length:1683 start_codon:yes stop_codon:yes gene_type:complete
VKGFGKKQNKNQIKCSDENLIKVALDFHAKGKINDALINYKKIINSGIEDPRVYCGMGLIVLQNKKIDQAIKYNLKAVGLDPKYSNAYSNLGLIFCQIGNFDEAEKYLRKAISIDSKDAKLFLNLGEILYKRLELDDAEEVIRQAIDLNPNIILSYYSLSKILRAKEDYLQAEKTIKKAIKIGPEESKSYFLLHEIYEQAGCLEKSKETLRKSLMIDQRFALAYYALSRFSFCKDDKDLYDNLFKLDTQQIKSREDKINILFAKSNLRHRQNKFLESSKYLKEANDLKLKLYNSSADKLIQKSKDYLIETSKFQLNESKKFEKPEECVFIVGMPRSGSTLTESILSINDKSFDLGERPLIENAFQKSCDLFKNSEVQLSFYQLYLEERNKFVNTGCISTDKYLYNYIYLGFILSNFPSAKVIHSFRNPLDNILSIYRSHFSEGVRFSSSLRDCARVYVNHMLIIKEYQRRFPMKIYPLNYDLLVSNPSTEIRNLISWLDWDWDDIYLSPHLVHRNIKTASVIQARSPINSNSVGGWKNYKNMLEPAIIELGKYEVDDYQY